MKLARRAVLQAAGVSLMLPWLECFAGAGKPKPKRRMVCICTPLGLYAPSLFPKQTGFDYESTPYLDIFKDLRQDLSVISGLSHPDINFGHESMFSFLTAAPRPAQPGFRNTISLDQFAAEHLNGETRFDTLPLSDEGFSLAWTRSGALVPSSCWPSDVFKRLFLEGSKEEVRTQIRRLRDGQSILDQIGDKVDRLHTGLGTADREKLDEYVTSVRELEKRLATAEEWAHKPKPHVDAKQPENIMNQCDILGRTRLLFDMTHLAIQTDSTRLVTILLSGITPVPLVPGVSEGHHNLSHHGQDPGKIEQLQKVETAMFEVLRGLLDKLKQSQEEGETLLDRTMVMLGSNLGNGSSHSCKNLPLLLAGGGFKHGQHLAFDPDKSPPLSNLYVSMLQRLGLEVDAFGSSTGTLAGLDVRA